jgi:hypothetical protein
MTEDSSNVKVEGEVRVKPVRDFIDSHPRLGWWIAGVSTLNVVLNVVELVVK